ncbi:ATP-grasp domain-containing protein [Abyssisolibacter fermentans]|uniref:ATP-grasp domain-containing protein n=1 Tax=Abyssisolibacter fermentans TaxID=1766203 RepID=UPI00082DBEFF|nr:ATP-grasp domain-containing protein [Abyssisolibacter fermentans]
MKKKLLFIESNTSGTGMLALEKSKKLGYYPVMITNNPKRYLGLEKIDCQVIECNTNSLVELKNCIEYKFKIDEISGIMTTSEFYIVTVAELTKYFGLPCNSPESMKICRNKAKTRIRLEEVQVRQPKFIIVNSVEDIKSEKMDIVGLPCVVKPVDDSGSNNVCLCETIEQVKKQSKKILREELNVREQEKEHAVLIEEYLDFPEYSVEMFTSQNKTYCIGITEKKLIGYPYFVEYQHIFNADLSENIKKEIELTVRKALKAVGITFGATHTEIKLTPKGCAIVEINARLAGGMIPQLIKYVTGIDMLQNQIKIAVGQVPELNIVYTGYSGIQFLTANEEGIFKGVNGIEEVKEMDGTKEVKITYLVDKPIKRPKNAYHRLGYFIVTAKTYEQTQLRLENVKNRLRIIVSN